MNSQNESKLHFFARCREILRRRHHRPFHELERPPQIEPLEQRWAPAVVGVVTMSGGETTVQLTGDGADDTFTFGVSKAGNLTHMFPLGTGAGQFETNEDFDSKQPGVQPAPANGLNTRVNIDGGDGKDKLDFSGLPAGVNVEIGVGKNIAFGSNGAFNFSNVEVFVGTDAADTFRVRLADGDSVSVMGGGGDDSIKTFGKGTAVVDGGGGADLLEGNNEGSATIGGGDGNDTITAKSDTLVINGGKDNDQITIKSGDKATVNVDGGDGDDTIEGSKADSTILGGAGDDSIKGGKGDESINGGDGNDTVDGGKGRNVITGAKGSNSMIGSAKTTLLEEGQGFALVDGKLDATIGGVGGTDILVGQFALIQLNGDGGANTIDASGYSRLVALSGLGGDDTIMGSAGGGTLNGGAGNDNISGGAKKDILGVDLTSDDSPFYDLQNTVGSGQGNDLLGSIDGAIINAAGNQAGVFIDAFNFSVGSVTLLGGLGNDTFASGSGNDLVIGNDGDDSIFINAGKDKFFGGDGLDRIAGDFVPTGLNVAANNLRGSASHKLDIGGGVFRTQKTSVLSVEAFSGSPFADKFTLTAPSKIDLNVNGGDGADIINAFGGGGLFINGDGGDDKITSKQSFGAINAGAGNDIVRVFSRFGLTIEGGTGTDLLIGGGGDDGFLAGDGEADTVDGGRGKDAVITVDKGLDVLKNTES